MSDMSLMILECMHVCCWQAHLVKMGHFSRYNHPHILCMCSKSLQSDDRLICDIEISAKTQNQCLKSVCNFKVTRFYLILLCKQHNWTLGTYSIEIITHKSQMRNSIFVQSVKCLLMILECKHVYCWQAHLVKTGHFSRYNHPHNLCMCSKSLQSDDRLICHIEISGKTRAVARKKLQPRRTHGPLYEISRMKSSNIISLIKKIKIDSIW